MFQDALEPELADDLDSNSRSVPNLPQNSESLLAQGPPRNVAVLSLKSCDPDSAKVCSLNFIIRLQTQTR